MRIGKKISYRDIYLIIKIYAYNIKYGKHIIETSVNTKTDGTRHKMLPK